MTRLNTGGYEENTVAATGGEIEAAVAGALSVGTTNVRTGTYALKALCATNKGSVTHSYTSLVGAAVGYHRFYLYLVTLPSANTAICSIEATGGRGAGDGLDIRLTTAGKLQLWGILGAVQRGSDSAALSLNTWYRVECSCDGSGNLAARIDGVNFATSATDAGNTGFMKLGVATDAGANVVTGEWWFDDWAVNNNSGAAQNSWPGAGSVAYLRPNAAGDSSLGAGPSTGAFSDVDEVTPNGATDKAALVNVADFHLWNVDSATTAIGSGATPILVQVAGVIAATSATACNYKWKIKSGATTSDAGVVSTASATYHYQDDTANSRHLNNPTATPPLWLTDPDTAAAWTVSGLDAVQIGFGSTDVTPNPLVTAAWLVVEYTPGAAAAVSDLALSPLRPYFHLLPR